MNIKKIREDFTILRNKPKMCYFDSACVSLKPDQVVDAMNQYYYEFPACVGRSMHKLGETATHHVEQARKNISKYFSAKKDKEIIFTRNTSEGLNLLAKSLKLQKGATVITTGKEHNSNLVPWLRLKELGKINHDIIPLKEDNTVDLDAYHQMLDKGNIQIVSIQHGANLDGTTTPLKEMIKLAHDYKAKVIVDAAQSAGHTEINVRKLDMDFMACSGHKMLGPSGIGALYGKEEELENLNPFLQGGDTVKETCYDKYVPEDLPEPSDVQYTRQLMQAMLPVIKASDGRVFLLFTSYRAMNEANDFLKQRLDYQIFVQGQKPKHQLLSAFKEAGQAVLLGTSSFWEGVDVRGDALTCVMIDKLPFASPGDPVLQARMDQIRNNGGNPFMDFQLPTAVISLKQGAGRLIRDLKDYGVLVIGDPRILSKRYGKTFIKSLPEMPVTQSIQAVEGFYQKIRQQDETVA